MNTDLFSDAKIVESWGKNARPWTVAVREEQIESRKLITDHAIVDAILSRSPRSVLDIGCGEGWLSRELATRNIHVVGVDVVPGLIEAAQRTGGGDFRAISYEEIAAGELRVSVDVVVCNFSLLGKESVEGVFRATPSLLDSHGSFIVQTLHPAIACGDLPYQDGWREGSWTGFSADFSDPAPWYFRTLESWIKLFVGNGFRLREVREPLHPKTQKPASVVFIGEMAAGY
jgi:2-polyprenyl-3-methyl-5-hydroxy-6-metoxy-1,4-benzoquinol methylase